MSKKRKTKKEKVLTETRKHTVSSSEVSSIPTYSFSSSSVKEQNTLEPHLHRTVHSYVIKDIRHTLIITSLLFGSSVVLFVLIQSHIIRLANFGY